MNHLYRIVWSQAACVWVAVSEFARGQGKSTRSKLVAAAVTLGAALAQAEPVGGQVVAGTASIAQSGATTTIRQTSQNLSLNWQSFNIAPQETVNFVQPAASAIAVNRIFDTNGTKILGQLNANGQVYLINPNGILFGQGAQVNVGALVASTLDFNDASLNGNSRTFSGSGSGSIINQGTINATGTGGTSGTGGYVALLGNTVRNQGTITAPQGTVALGAGSSTTLTFQNNSLVKMQVDQSVLNSLADNGGLIRADGGLVVMSAGAKNALLASVVNNTGVIEARTVQEHNGTITLLGGMTAGSVNVGGTLDASAPNGGKGGRIEVTAERVLIAEGAYLTASGKTGGGDVLVGGSWQNSEPAVRQATGTTVAPGARLQANATDSGNGGTVVVWSDIHHPDSVTRAYGSFEAKGGPKGGDGGRIETSGHWLDTQGARGSAAAPKGNAGLWLFDPYDITITSASANGSFAAGVWTPSGNTSTILNTTINTLLSAGTDVTISTGGTGSAGTQSGDITVSSAITKSAGTTATLALQAARNINVNADITSSSGALNITLSAANTTAAASSTAGTLGGVDVNANLASNGGNILIGGGAGSTTNGIGYALNQSTVLSAVTIEANKSITSSGGNITINGKSLVGSSSGNYSGVKGGIYILSGATILSGTGNLNMFGESSAGSKTFGLAVEANSGTLTTIGTSPTSGNAVINGINTTLGVTDTDRANGALGLVNNGNIDRLSLLGKSVANMSVQVNNSTQLITFTPGTGCVSGYAYCGKLVVPGSNNSYLYAGYSVNSTATQAITVQTGDGTKQYNGDAIVSGLTYTVTGAPVGYSTSSLSFLTAGSNVASYAILDNSPIPNPTQYVLGGVTYAVGYFKGNYSITAKPITASYTGINKQYDGATTGSVSGTSSGLISGDTVTFNTTAATFADKNVGSSKTISVTGASLGGTHAGNYSLASTTGSTTANITAKPLTVSGLSANNKTYDGTTTATVIGTASFSGVIPADIADVIISTGSVTGAFTDKDVGVGKAINLSGVTLSGAQSGNYTVAGVAGVSATISAKALSATIAVPDKIYDGNRTAAATFSILASGLVGLETVTASGAATFDTKDAGTGKTVTANSNTLTDGANGGLASNYSLVSGQTRTAAISAKALTMSGLSSADKVYDGTTTAVVSGTAALQAAINAGTGTSIDGKAYTGDDVNLTGTGSGEFANASVGSAKAVTVRGFSLGGLHKGNYRVVQPTGLTADITALSVVQQPESITFAPKVDYYPQTLNLSPTLTVKQSAGTGIESTASMSLNPAAGSNIVGVNKRVMGSTNQILNIGATGAVLQIIDGGALLQDTMTNDN